MWDLIPRPGIEPGPPALGARSLNHCATREVSVSLNSWFHFHLGRIFLKGAEF